MKEVTQELPQNLRTHGAKLYKDDNGERIKYVLENKNPFSLVGTSKEKFRSFIYINKKESSSSLFGLIQAYDFQYNLDSLTNKEKVLMNCQRLKLAGCKSITIAYKWDKDIDQKPIKNLLFSDDTKKIDSLINKSKTKNIKKITYLELLKELQ